MLRSALDELANGADPLRKKASDFKWFKHLDSPHVDKFSPDCLAPDLRETMRGFDILPADVAANMGHEGVSVCLLSWQYKPNEYGYWAELCTPVPVPDETSWPQ